MKSFAKFREARDSLARAYAELLACGVLPVETVTPSIVLQRRADLLAETFSAAVCGQMNAGKSTLLNALVFQSAVLPMADTEMTATVTFLEFAEKAGFEVQLLTTKEWAEVRQARRQDEKERNEFDSLVSAAHAAGHPIHEYVTDGGRTIRQDGYDNLRVFVSTTAKGGYAAPYVRSVRVFHTNAAYRSVTLVDTPGLDTPNPVRDRITKEWINHAHAVLYVTYAGQAGLNAQDVRFVDQHLLHIPSSTRILAVNKLDTATSPEEVQANLDRLRHGNDPRIRAILTTETAQCLVSALGRLAALVKARGEPLDGAMEHLESRKPVYLRDEGNGVEALRHAVEDRLIANKGERLLQSHSAFIDGVFVWAERKVDAERERFEDAKELASKTLGELKRQRIDLESQRDSAQVEIEDRRASFENSLEGVLTGCGRKIDGIREDVRVGVENRLQRVRKTHQFEYQLAWILVSEADAQRSRIAEVVRSARDDTQREIDQMIALLKAELTETAGFRPRRLDTLVNLSALELAEPVGESFSREFDREQISAIVRECTMFLQRWFDTSGGIENVHAALSAPVGQSIRRVFENEVKARLFQMLRQRAGRAVEAIQLAVNTAFQEKEEQLEELMENEGSQQQVLADAKAQLAELDTRRKTIADLKARVASAAEPEAAPDP